MVKKTYPVVRQAWTESERGWGQRPDGYSLHFNAVDCSEFKKTYTKDRKGPAPDVYDFPSGEPTVVDVDEKTYKQIKTSENGIRI